MDRAADAEIRSHWDSHHRHKSDDPDFWMADPDCRRAINRRVTGDPDLWPLDGFRRRHARRPFRRALSLGCGSGALERSARRLGICEKITGIDASETSLAEARTHAAAEKLDGIAYMAVDLNTLRLARKGFDAVFFHQSLHHVRSVEKLLARVARALAPDGLLYLDEWTGPSRSEWTPGKLARAAALFAALPPAWRRQPEIRAPVERYDLSETVRSSAILPAVRRLFEVLEERPYGGHLVAVLLPQLALDVVPPAARRELVARWLALEDEDLERDPSCGYHTVLVARPRRGAAALLGRGSNFAVRAGLALRYRVPTAIRIVTGRHTSSAALPPHLRNW